MSGFNKLEGEASRLLARFPRTKVMAKKAYQSANYLLFGERGFKVWTHPNVLLTRPPLPNGREDAQITDFFGYYDNSPWSSDGRWFAYHRRVPNSNRVEIILGDFSTSEARVIGSSEAWNLQQGAMLRWLPGHMDGWIAFNDQSDGEIVSSFINPNDGKDSAIQIKWPVQAIHPDGSQGISLNYSRLYRLNSDYGYDLPANNFPSGDANDEDGLWCFDLKTGQGEVLISFEDALCAGARTYPDGTRHELNHAMYSPTGKHLVFIHRYYFAGGRRSRLLTCRPDGSNLTSVLETGMVSHYTWINDHRLLVYGNHLSGVPCYCIIDLTDEKVDVQPVDALSEWGDGHPSCSPDGKWIVFDTYPDRKRQQHLVLFDLKGNRIHRIGRFLAPLNFFGSNRCDLHPRWDRLGGKVSIDSAHSGIRQTYIIDVSKIAGGENNNIETSG